MSVNTKARGSWNKWARRCCQHQGSRSSLNCADVVRPLAAISLEEYFCLYDISTQLLQQLHFSRCLWLRYYWHCSNVAWVELLGYWISHARAVCPRGKLKAKRFNHRPRGPPIHLFTCGASFRTSHSSISASVRDSEKTLTVVDNSWEMVLKLYRSRLAQAGVDVMTGQRRRLVGTAFWLWLLTGLN